MTFELYEIKESDKDIILNLMQLYTYELSFYEDETTNFNMMDNGLFAMSKYIDMYWTKENRHPYILKCDDKLAGFVLIRFNEDNMYEVAEFFILNKYRHIGAGKFMANKVFNKYKGSWEVRTLLKNERAQNFWRSIIKDYTNNNFVEKLIRDNSRYAFYFNN